MALPFKLFGVKYLFDHHDVNPELYEAKFNNKGIFYKIMLLLEKLTFKTASHSIATNESYKEIALTRGKMKETRVTVIRSGPKPERLIIGAGNVKYKKGKKYLIGYLGVIGEQEGIDLLLEAFKILLQKRNDVQLAIVGGGTSLNSLIALSKEMHLENDVDFYGRVPDELLLDVLNTADVCVNPDKPTAMNNLSTMNKIMEYMALKKPIVQFDLKEGKFSAQKASLYAKDVEDFALKLDMLLDDETLRKEMGEYGYNRILHELSWDYESGKLVELYSKVLNGHSRKKFIKEQEVQVSDTTGDDRVTVA